MLKIFMPHLTLNSPSIDAFVSELVALAVTKNMRVHAEF